METNSLYEAIEKQRDYERGLIKQRRHERELEKERKYREYREILDNLGKAELNALTAFLSRYGRKFPQTAHTLSKAILNFRSLRESVEEQTADERFYEQFRPLETLWTLEMREHTRIAYLPFKVSNRPFSKMEATPSIWTGTTALPSFIRRRTKRPQQESTSDGRRNETLEPL